VHISADTGVHILTKCRSVFLCVFALWEICFTSDVNDDDDDDDDDVVVVVRSKQYGKSVEQPQYQRNRHRRQSASPSSSY